jgi:hypothetical protein
MPAVLTHDAAPRAESRRRIVAANSAAATAAAFSLSAGLVHFGYVQDHWWVWPLYGMFFLAAGLGQALLAGLLATGHRAPWVLLTGIAGNLFIVVTYAISRTQYGAFIGPMRGHAELPGVIDMATTIGEVITIILLITLLPKKIAGHVTTFLLLVGVTLWVLRFTNQFAY